MRYGDLKGREPSGCRAEDLGVPVSCERTAAARIESGDWRGWVGGFVSARGSRDNGLGASVRKGVLAEGIGGYLLRVSMRASGRCADVGRARQDRQDDHRCSAVSTEERRCGGRARADAARTRRMICRGLEERARGGEGGRTLRVAEQAVVADAVEAAREHVEQEAP